MSDFFYIKKGDRRESLERILKGSNGLPVDLTAASSVKFFMKAIKTGVVKINSAAQIVAPTTDGHVRYNWGASDTDTAGTYDAEWEVLFGDGTKQSFPNDDNLVINILPDIA